jgi:putative transposase
VYYRARPESSENIELMHLLDEQYTATPFYGVRKMTEVLRQSGFLVGPKRVRRLLRTMGLQAIYQRPNLSRPAPGHRIYPYLLLTPSPQPNQRERQYHTTGPGVAFALDQRLALLL